MERYVHVVEECRMQSAASQMGSEGRETGMLFDSSMKLNYRKKASSLLKSISKNSSHCLVVSLSMVTCFYLTFRLMTVNSFEKALPFCAIWVSLKNGYTRITERTA